MEIGDLPIVPASLRATVNYFKMRRAMQEIKPIGRWSPQPGSGWTLGYRLFRVNIVLTLVLIALAAWAACLFYTPAIFLNLFVAYLEKDDARRDTRWGWVYVFGLFFSNAIVFLCKSFSDATWVSRLIHAI